MDAIHTKFIDFLNEIIQDPKLERLDPIDLIGKLQISLVLTGSEAERIEKCRSISDRKIVLFKEILPLKTSETFVKALGRISLEEDMTGLKEIIRSRYGDEYLSGTVAMSSSGFSSPFDEAVKYLRKILENDTEIMKKHWQNLMDSPEEFEMDEMFIDLVIIREGRRSAEHVSSYPELFGSTKRSRKYRKIVLEGDPGMGKTTYVHKLVQTWARNETDAGKWLNEEFKLVLIVRLGEVDEKIDLGGYLSRNIPEKFVKSIEHYISEPENHSQILFVLDAFDEMPKNEFFNNLIEKQKQDTQAVTIAHYGYVEIGGNPLKMPFYLFCLCLLLSISIATSKEREYKLLRGERFLSNSSRSVSKVPSRTRCEAACTKERDRCFSINYETSSRECQLNYDKRIHHVHSWEHESEFEKLSCNWYAEATPSPCDSVNCSGNGTCEETGPSNYTCTCKHGVTGRNCELMVPHSCWKVLLLSVDSKIYELDEASGNLTGVIGANPSAPKPLHYPRMAYNPDNGKLYRFSGYDPSTGFFESIDPVTFNQTWIPLGSVIKYVTLARVNSLRS